MQNLRGIMKPVASKINDSSLGRVTYVSTLIPSSRNRLMHTLLSAIASKSIGVPREC